MQTTTNLGLKKPEGTDIVNIDDFNYNSDAIDVEIKSLNDNKQDKVAGKGLSTNDYTTTEKNKLAAIATGANNYTHPSTHAATMIAEDSTHRFVTDTEKTSWNGKASTAIATTSINGLMSSTDKSKLDGIATGAQVNQNAFSNVKVGTTTVAADSATDTLELVAGNNITLTPDATNDKITIAATGYTHPNTHPASMIVAVDGTTMEQFKTSVVSDLAEKAAETDNTRTTTSKTVTGAINELNSNKVATNNYVANNAYATTTGTSTAYTVTLNPVPVAYTDGMSITILPHVDSGATPTLNVNGLGVSTIVKQDGTAIASGEIKANKPLSLVRVGSNFFIRSSGGGSVIKSFQRGSTSVFNSSLLTTDITISPVDITKAVVEVESLGYSGSPSPASYQTLFNAEFINSTTIRLTRSFYTALDKPVQWRVTEFNNLKSVQRGSVTATNGGNTQTIPVSAVDVNKVLIYVNWTPVNSNSDNREWLIQKYMSSATALYITTSAYYAFKYNWTLVEFN